MKQKKTKSRRRRKIILYVKIFIGFAYRINIGFGSFRKLIFVKELNIRNFQKLKFK